MAKKKLTGYFIEDHPEIMDRLQLGKATADDQKKIAAALYDADVYEDVYMNCTSKIEPYVERAGKPDGELPASLCDSLDILLEFWNEHRENPACKEEVMALIRKGLNVGAKYSLDPCIEALAKLDSVTTSTIIQRIAKATPKAAYLAPGFPSRLIKWREYAGLTQEELARKAMVNVPALQGYENGVKNPQPRTVRRLVNALNIPLSKLVDGENEQQIPIGASSVKKHSVDEETE